MWVSSHRGIEGTKKTDILAEEEANTPFPFLLDLKSNIKGKLPTMETELLKRYWSNVKGLRLVEEWISISE